MENNDDIVVQSFDLQKLAKSATFPLICVYKYPADYPGKYIARLWDINIPTNIIAIAESLETIREIKPLEMVILPRQTNDDPCIVETWI